MAPSSSIPTVFKRARPATRSTTANVKSTPKRADRARRPGVLSGKFKPILASAYGEPADIAISFYRSLNLLCEHYQLILNPRKGDFPEVMNEITAEVSKLLEKQCRLETMLIYADDGQVYLTTVEVLPTNQTLYYLPVRPVWNINQCKTESALSDLLLTLYSFFYSAHSVTYFTEPGYIDRQYDVLQNWALENEDEEEQNWQLDGLNDLHDKGNKIFALINPHFETGDLRRSLDAYEKSAEPDPKIIAVAKEALAITEAHPGRNLIDDIRIDIRAPEEDYHIYPDQYISFYWSGHDDFYDALIDMVSSELQEYGIIEEPAHYTVFNGDEIAKADFDFEKRMFALICDLCEFLDPYDHEEYNPRPGGDLSTVESAAILPVDRQ